MMPDLDCARQITLRPQSMPEDLVEELFRGPG